MQTKRAFKAFPLTSPDINRDVGHYLQEHLGTAVDLDTAELTVSIEILPMKPSSSSTVRLGRRARCRGKRQRRVSAVRRHRFAGGGLSHVEARLHGGVPAFSQLSDSHRVSQEKVRDLVTLLTRYQFVSKLMLIPSRPFSSRSLPKSRPPIVWCCIADVWCVSPKRWHG